MKKIYIEPSVKAVEINTKAILAPISGPVSQGEAPGTVTPDCLDADFDDFDVEEADY